MEKRTESPAQAGSASFMPRDTPYPTCIPYVSVARGCPRPDCSGTHSPTGQCRTSSSGSGKSETFAVANAAPTPKADAAIRQSAWWRVMPPLSEFTTPTARTLRFCGVQRRQPQRSHQPTRRQFLAGSKSATYLLDRNRRHPWFHPDPSQSLDAISGRPTPEGIDQNRRIEHQPRHAQPDRRESPLRCARTQPAGSSSHSWPVSEIVPQGCFDVVPPTLVLETASDQLGDESTTPPRSRFPVECRHQFVIQLNV